MYQLTGVEFSDLITRAFTAQLSHHAVSAALPHIFDCHTTSLKTADFDLLRFQASFEEETRIHEFQDISHVSMHFQLAGRSNASISSFNQDQPMQQQQFNILNCVDPVSSFLFPKQSQYDYLCVGLTSAFFNEVLLECGDDYRKLLNQSLKKEGFTLFKEGAIISRTQLEVLRMLQKPPVADNLKGTYLKSKVKELILLSLSASSACLGIDASIVSAGDREKLNAVKSYLEVDFLSSLSLEGISRNFLLNEFKLKRGFKALFGSTVFGYIQQLRMEHAALLLSSGGLTIGEVAALVGYTSDSSFIRAFKAHYGSSPGKFKSP